MLSGAAIRCCPVNVSCADCESAVVGYSMARGSVMIGCMSLMVLLLLGSIITSGVGRHCAWLLERYRVIREYREKQLLRRQEVEAYKRELRETELDDVEESEACVICCARYKDCGLVPCGHVCCCHFCAKRLKECPVCRGAVAECYRLPSYLVRQLVGLNAEEAASHDSGDEGGHKNAVDLSNSLEREEEEDRDRIDVLANSDEREESSAAAATRFVDDDDEDDCLATDAVVMLSRSSRVVAAAAAPPPRAGKYTKVATDEI